MRCRREIEYPRDLLHQGQGSAFQELCACVHGLSGAFVRSQMEDPVERLRATGRRTRSSPSATRPLPADVHDAHPALEPSSQPHRGNPEEDAYAFLRATVADGIRAGASCPSTTTRRPGAADVGGGARGGVAAHRKGEDTWVRWAPERTAVRQMIDTLVGGSPGRTGDGRPAPRRLFFAPLLNTVKPQNGDKQMEPDPAGPVPGHPQERPRRAARSLLPVGFRSPWRALNRGTPRA